MKDILSMLPEEILADFREKGFPAFRAKQVSQWLAKGVSSFDEMKNLPLDLRTRLTEEYSLYRPEVLRKQVSAKDGTIKYLWGLSDGNAVETVVMKYRYGNTVCISTQVGCRQGCAFCASTIGGLVRQMEPSEMLNEVLFSQKDSGETISHVVLMGTGEPLDNFDNVMRFLRLLNHPDVFNLSLRHVSLSTCGIIERFDDLAQQDLQLTLAVSLHAPDDETRSRLMPANRGRGVDALMKACRDYTEKTGRRVSFEYSLVQGQNDSEAFAVELGKLLHGKNCHVNLIPVNPIKERNYKDSDSYFVEKFKLTLEKLGINVTIRREMGRDIDAACGQLRRSYMKQKEEE